MTRTTRLLALSTWGLIGLMLALGFLSPLPQDPITRGVYPALASVSGVVLFLVAGIVLFVKPFSIETRSGLPWLVGGVAVFAVLFPITLWHVGRTGLGYQFFQSLKVGTSPYGFGDLELTLSHLNCVRLGVDVYSADAFTCAIGPSNYGPGWLWLAWLGLGPQHTTVLGVAMAVISGLVLMWLTRFSSGFGQIALLCLAISPAWILLVERGNVEVMLVWCGALLVWLVRRMPGRLLPWVLGAVPIWILGTWKYYPFAMVLALLPSLQIRRGWVLVSGFLASAVVYLFISRETVALSLESNAGLSGGNLWGIGRDGLAAVVSGQAKSDVALGWADVLILVMIVVALAWGWSVADSFVGGDVSTKKGKALTLDSVVAIGGVTGVLVAVGLSGFGYQYKAAGLIAAVPLLARLTRSSSATVWRSAVAMLILTVVGNVVVWNIVISSVTVLVVAAFSTGVALRALVPYMTLWLTSQRSGALPGIETRSPYGR